MLYALEREEQAPPLPSLVYMFLHPLHSAEAAKTSLLQPCKHGDERDVWASDFCKAQTTFKCGSEEGMQGPSSARALTI